MWTLSGFADEIDPDLVTQCRVLTDLGISWVELRSAWGVNVLDLSDEQVAQAQEVLREHGIRVSSIGSPIGKIGIRDDLEAHLVRMDRALELARRFEAPYIRLFSFFMPPGEDPADHRDEVLRRMRALTDRAEGTGVVLLHENEKEIYGDVPERVLDVVTSVGSPALRLAWDSANYVQCGVRPVTQGYDALRPYTDYIQVKDALLATGEVVPSGEGDGEVRELVRRLLADGYDGFFSMEPHLARTTSYGGFSGADEFGRATEAFTAILESEGATFQ